MPRVILLCPNGCYDSNIKVLLIVVKEVKKNKVSFIGNIINSSKRDLKIKVSLIGNINNSSKY